MLKKIAAGLFILCFALALLVLCTTGILGIELAEKAISGNVKDVPFDQIEAVTYFLRASGVMVGIMVLVRWVTKWPWPVSWLSLAIGATAFAFAAVGHRFQLSLWGAQETLPWWPIVFTLSIVSTLCAYKWAFDPSWQKKRPK